MAQQRSGWSARLAIHSSRIHLTPTVLCWFSWLHTCTSVAKWCNLVQPQRQPCCVVQKVCRCNSHESPILWLTQGYNSATMHFVWLVRSPGTVYHWTFIQHLHYQRSKTCSRHIFSHVPT